MEAICLSLLETCLRGLCQHREVGAQGTRNGGTGGGQGCKEMGWRGQMGGLWKGTEGGQGAYCDCKEAAGLNFKPQGMGVAGGGGAWEHCKPLCPYPVRFWLER